MWRATFHIHWPINLKLRKHNIVSEECRLSCVTLQNPEQGGFTKCVRIQKSLKPLVASTVLVQWTWRHRLSGLNSRWPSTCSPNFSISSRKKPSILNKVQFRSLLTITGVVLHIHGMGKRFIAHQRASSNVQPQIASSRKRSGMADTFCKA